MHSVIPMMYVNFVTRALTISGSTDSRGDIERGVRERRRKGKGGGVRHSWKMSTRVWDRCIL